MAEITIGTEALDRTNFVASQTTVNKNNPANDSGIITSVEIWANLNLENCEVATFYVVSGNNLSTRGTHTIGNVIAGSKQTFDGLSIAVQEGDYIGIYYTAGRLDEDLAGGDGYWWTAIDNIPCTNVTFAPIPGEIISLYGTGTTGVAAVAKKNVIFMGSNL